MLFAGLRDHEDFGAAIERTERLSSSVLGVGVYDAGGRILYSWGQPPPSYSVDAPPRTDEGSRVRAYVENESHDSLVLLLRPWRPPPPPRSGDAGPPPPPHPFFDTLRKAELVYLEIRQPLFWSRERFRRFLFPAVEAALAAAVLFVTLLAVRNAEYRSRLETQKNLVMLGTAASTLAHELKNPLLSIRLQTSILAKTAPRSAREIDIINSEVDRLAAMAHHVNDYLRDPAGEPRLVDPAEIATEVGRRLCGRDLVRQPSGPVGPRALIDPERLRSIVENLLRNALESGGSPEGIEIEVAARDGAVLVDVLDRGPGVPFADRERAFDPFFTTKSRGTGIGLAISRRFAFAAGAALTLEDRPGGGCRARLALREADGRGGGRGA